MKIIDQMYENNEITDKTRLYLLKGGSRTSQFHMLPKIHKSLENPPARPIVSSTDCPTEKLSQMLDIILNPYVKETKSFVRDMTDFINKISKIDDLGDDDWIFSMDVTGLYTNIPTAEGIDTIWQIIKDRYSNPPNSRIIEILEFVLKHNNFKFNGTNFLQLEGTAMGTRVAPTYANLFMSQFESKHIYQYEKAPLFGYFLLMTFREFFVEPNHIF